MSGARVDAPAPTLATAFLTALGQRDFDRLQACFADRIHFRALIPSGLREGNDAIEAARWFHRWFGDADEFQVLAASMSQVADRLHIAYRIRVRERHDWSVVEQQAYCATHSGLIDAMHLLCSGFRPDLGQWQEQSEESGPTTHPQQ